jgi:hypothetical protein
MIGCLNQVTREHGVGIIREAYDTEPFDHG